MLAANAWFSRVSKIECSLFISAYTVSVLIAEALLYYTRTEIALLIYCTVVIGFCLAPLWANANVGLFQGFVLLAVFRIVDLTFPQITELPLFRMALVYIPVFIAVGAVLSRNNEIELQTNQRAWLFLPLILLIGGVMAVGEFAVLRPASLIGQRGVANVLFFVLLVGVWVSLTEELLFRGLLQQAIALEQGAWAGRILSSILYSAFYSIYLEPMAIPAAFVLGMIYAMVYDLLGDIGITAFLHTLANILAFGLLPLYIDQLPYLGQMLG